MSVLPDRDVVPMHPASGDQPAGPIALRDYGRSKVLRFFDLPWVSARWFFRSHAGLLSREVILRIARLTDNEETGAQRNLVLASILSDAGIDAVPDLREELSHELEELHELSKAVRHHRHKYLAHLDHAAATGAAPPALPVTWEDIARLIDSVERIYHRYRSAVYDSDADLVLHALGGPADLVRVLRAGEQWRAHVQQILREECTNSNGGAPAA